VAAATEGERKPEATRQKGPVLDTSTPPVDARRIEPNKPALLLTEEHHMCPGCGEPLAVRQFLETIEDLGQVSQAIAVAGIGCYTSFSGTMDVDLVQALHGRAPSVATGVKRMLPDALVVTLQGDGDMVNEGLQEVLHTAARGENLTCILLNNGVFGETGGHMTSTSVLGQRTKNTLDGRDAEYHGYPILIGDLVATLQGAAYVARGSVHNAGAVARTKKMFRRAFETQVRKDGFSFVEVLTMCPTGWFVPTADGPGYMQETLGEVHIMGELKVDGNVRTTEELHAENVAKQHEVDTALARGGLRD
jgi:2-oxoglutarate ferredoxin oxidoreductase subunit beta